MELLQPRGMRDFSPSEKIARERTTHKLKEVFERYGFVPLETPVLERYETLSAKYAGGAEILKEMFTLEDQGKRKLALRYDLTVPLARFVAQNQNLKLPFKRYAIEKVYRDGPIKLGRTREFYQCDCDIVGSASAMADAQCLELGIAVFAALEMPVRLTTNNMGLLRAMLMHDGVSEAQLTDAMLILDKLKKIGQEGVEAELAAAHIPASGVREVIGIAQRATNEERLAAIRERYGHSEHFARTQEVLELVPSERITFDPSLSRGLAYYTGMVFEGYLESSPVTSSVCGGGRYDTMIGAFVGRPNDYPAVGISFGLEPIMEALRGTISEQQTSVQAFIVPIKTPKESAALAQTLRSHGINTDIDLIGRGPSKNLEYASALDIPHCVILGEKELSQGMLRLRNMQSGEEELLEIEALIGRLLP